MSAVCFNSPISFSGFCYWFLVLIYFWSWSIFGFESRNFWEEIFRDEIKLVILDRIKLIQERLEDVLLLFWRKLKHKSSRYLSGTQILHGLAVVFSLGWATQSWTVFVNICWIVLGPQLYCFPLLFCEDSLKKRLPRTIAYGDPVLLTACFSGWSWMVSIVHFFRQKEIRDDIW